MKKAQMLPVALVVMVALAVAVPVQADLVSLTLILTAIWTSGVVLNETVINPADQQDGQAVQEDDGHLPDFAYQTQSD